MAERARVVISRLVNKDKQSVAALHLTASSFSNAAVVFIVAVALVCDFPARKRSWRLSCAHIGPCKLGRVTGRCSDHSFASFRPGGFPTPARQFKRRRAFCWKRTQKLAPFDDGLSRCGRYATPSLTAFQLTIVKQPFFRQVCTKRSISTLLPSTPWILFFLRIFTKPPTGTRPSSVRSSLGKQMMSRTWSTFSRTPNHLALPQSSFPSLQKSARHLGHPVKSTTQPRTLSGPSLNRPSTTRAFSWPS